MILRPEEVSKIFKEAEKNNNQEIINLIDTIAYLVEILQKEGKL